MPENAPGFTALNVAVPPHTLIGGPENLKLLFDDQLANSREVQARARAWENLSLLQHQSLTAFVHAVNMGSLLSAQAGVTQQQTGVTENQQPVSPIRTGAADAQNQQPAGAVYPPIRNVDQTGATATGAVQTAQAQVAANIAALSDAVTKLSEVANILLARAAGTGAQGAGSPQPASVAQPAS